MAHYISIISYARLLGWWENILLINYFGTTSVKSENVVQSRIISIKVCKVEFSKEISVHQDTVGLQLTALTECKPWWCSTWWRALLSLAYQIVWISKAARNIVACFWRYSTVLARKTELVLWTFKICFGRQKIYWTKWDFFLTLSISVSVDAKLRFWSKDGFLTVRSLSCVVLCVKFPVRVHILVNLHEFELIRLGSQRMINLLRKRNKMCCILQNKSD